MGKTILIAEHRIAWLWDLCDRVIIMDQGKIHHDFADAEKQQVTPEQCRNLGLRSFAAKDPQTIRKTCESSESDLVFETLRFPYEKGRPILDLSNLRFAAGAGAGTEGKVNAVVGANGAGKTTLLHCMAGLKKKVRGTGRFQTKKIIADVSIVIPEKTTTAVVGPSGSGKRTLCHLLSRFWDVDGGQVSLGGRDLRSYSMDSLMKNFSFVFQNVYLFQDTIANNIRFGQPDAPLGAVIDAAKKAKCHDFIMALPKGYDTVIGESGGTLSGGERQRLSIARAMMKDAPIIILDEATANVDPENEKDLMTAIEELTREKTIIMIAHRLKTVRDADQILVMDQGRIVQNGDHDSLMEEDGIYRNFICGRQQAVSWKL